MNKTSLPAKLRTVLGRKIKQLRKQGLLPANIYGKKVKSQAVSVDAKKFAEVFSKAGETGLLELELDGKKLPVLIHNVSYHPVTNQTLHADFYAVDLKEKVEANVPLLIIGESPAVKDKTGVLLINLDELHVEALPQDLPEKIEVDIANLVKLDDAIKVADLPVSDKIKILTDLELEVAKIAPLVVKEKVEEAPITVAVEGEEGEAAEAVAGEEASVPEKGDKSEKPENQAKQ